MRERADATGGTVPAPVAALVRWAGKEFGEPVVLVDPPETKGEGFDSIIHLVQMAGAQLPEDWRVPLAMRIKSDAGRLDEAKREALVQGWVADRGYPAPRVIRVFAPGELLDRPVQIMQRAPGVLVFDEIVRRPWRARSAVRCLGRLHAQLHELDPRRFPAAGDLLERRLAFTRRTAELFDHHALRAALARVERIADDLRTVPDVVCHGDFHPLNVLLDGTTATVIDWTDAGLGDAAGDVARTLVLFDMAAIAAESRATKAALRVIGPRLGRAYRKAYSETRTLDTSRIALWTPVHLLHGWSQVVGLHAGQFAHDDAGDERTRRVPTDLGGVLQERFEQSLRAIAA